MGPSMRRVLRWICWSYTPLRSLRYHRLTGRPQVFDYEDRKWYWADEAWGGK